MIYYSFATKYGEYVASWFLFYNNHSHRFDGESDSYNNSHEYLNVYISDHKMEYFNKITRREDDII